jgi:hypothetical protein
MSNSKNIVARIQNKHAVEADWVQAVNFVPLAGEMIIYDVDEVHDKPRIKFGDGVTPVNDLDFTVDNSAESGVDITCGTSDPDANTVGQFYFKYSN